MTDEQWETYTRSLLNEGTATFWTAADMAAYKQVALIIVSGNFWSLLFPLKKRNYDYDLVAGDNFLDLPIGWQKIVRVEEKATGRPLDYIPDREIPTYENADGSQGPCGWMFNRGKIHPLPNPTSAMADHLRLWYLPRPETLADLPEDLHPLVAVEAAIAARTKDENVSPYLLGLRERMEMVARKALAQLQTQVPLKMDDDYQIDSD